MSHQGVSSNDLTCKLAYWETIEKRPKVGKTPIRLEEILMDEYYAFSIINYQNI